MLNPRAPLDEVSREVERVIEIVKVSHCDKKETVQQNDKKRAEELSNGILVFPFPEEAKDRHEPVEGARITGCLCELTLGNEVYLTSEEVPRQLGPKRGGNSDYTSSPFLTIEPGEFAVLITHEYIYLPLNVMGLISIRNSYKTRGLVSVSGFHADPGFRGHLIFTAYNAGPSEIVLRYRERMFMIAFAEVSDNDTFYWTSLNAISTETVSQLRGTSVSPRNLEERVKRLETILTVVLVPLIIALVVAIIKLL